MKPLLRNRNRGSNPYRKTGPYPIKLICVENRIFNMTIPIKSPGNSALRKGRCSVPGQIYFITFVTKNRNPIFSNWDLACAASRILADKSLWQDATLLTWVLMPDHFHGLVEIGENKTLAEIIKRVKGTSAREINRHLLQAGNLWAHDYHDHALRTDEDLPAVARYIVLNPVRAGLVRRCGDYAFWDAVWLS